MPLLMVYFAYGATGLIAVAQTFWVKKALTLSPADLSSQAVWLNIPWTVKMVFGELVDTVAIFGSRRRGYVYVGGALVAIGMLLLAGAASETIPIASPVVLYIAASLVKVIGLVLQDVVADAMSTEVVPRVDAEGKPRAKDAIDRELGMVQVLGRLALSSGVFTTAGLAGWLASEISYATVFLLGLVVPVISVSGAMMINLEAPERRAIVWNILAGGLVFGAFVVVLGIAQVPFGSEIVFAVSLAVIIWMLRRIAGNVDAHTRTKIADGLLAHRGGPCLEVECCSRQHLDPQGGPFPSRYRAHHAITAATDGAPTGWSVATLFSAR